MNAEAAARTTPPTVLGPPLLAMVARVEQALQRVLPAANEPPIELHRAMRYAVLGGGKRLRPLLVYATGDALGASDHVLDAPACAIEMVHSYSLVHDDLPAMDDDALRRGRPTCHIAFGEAMAILAGDALQALAFESLASGEGAHTGPTVHLRMLRVLSEACGSIGMAGGQALDLAAVGARLTPQQLERMHACKTGALIRAAVTLGALGAGCTQVSILDALDRYARAFGLAFQIRDDILDVEGDASVLGKTAGKDAGNAKPTFPSTLGMQASRVRLDDLTHSALAALDSLDADTCLLRELALFGAQRQR